LLIMQLPIPISWIVTLDCHDALIGFR
jgi:hypothetical protein